MVPTFSGKNALIKAGINTFPTARPIPMMAVPINKPAATAKVRRTIPATSRSKPTSITFPAPSLSEKCPTNTEIIPKAIRGIVVSIPAEVLDNPRPSRIVLTKEPTSVIGALNPQKITIIARNKNKVFLAFKSYTSIISDYF